MSSLTTKKAIANSFKELLMQKPIDKITVNDIAKNCDINRQTFYYHFIDIFDLIEWIWTEKVDKALENKNKYDTWQNKFLAVFDFILNEKKFIENIYDSVSIEIIRKSLYKFVYPIIYDEILEQTKNKDIKEEDRKFVTNFYLYAFVSLVLEWINKGMKEDPKKIVNKISQLLKGTVANLCKE